MRLFAKFVIVVLTLFSISQTVAAQDTKLGIMGTFSINQYKMSDINDDIDGMNRQGIDMDNITSGSGPGIMAILYTNKDRLLFCVNYERLNGSSSYSDNSFIIDFDVKANLIEFQTFVRSPIAGNVSLLIGGGIGQYTSVGEVEFEETGYMAGTGDINASCIGFRIMGGAELQMSDNIRFFGILGYRKAETGDITIDGNSVENYTLDYSGLHLRLGVGIVFAGKTGK